jgi:hypothetical protein
VAVQVIDGAIRNAQVCLDINGNSACDAGEPTARTDAAGKATLNVAPADAGKYPVVAIVGTDAVDADHGAVPVPFLLKAPADKPAVVSPLTTIVQNTVESSGTTSDKAAENLQAQLGMNVSVFQDYTSNRTREGNMLGAIARMIVVTQQQQTTALASAVGVKGIDGTAVSQSDIDKLVVSRLAAILPDIVSALADPAVQAAITAGDMKQLNTALQPLAASIVSDPATGLKPEAVAVLVGTNKVIASGGGEPPAPTPGAQLHTLTFTNAQNWFRRFLVTSAAEAVPDANGMVRYRDFRRRSVNGVEATWSFQSTPDRQSDFHWNGSTWVQCPLQQQGMATVRDAAGRSTYNYCDGFETGTTTRAAVDVAGRRMIDVYNEIQSAGYTNITITNAASALGTAVFPTGSRVWYTNGQPTGNAISYIPNTSNVVRTFNSDNLANGVKANCDTLTGSTPQSTYTAEPATLEAMVARLPGKACSYQAETFTGANSVQLTSGPRNEAWGLASVSLGQIGTAPLSGTRAASTSFWTTNQLLRVSFGPNSTVKYYSCRQRQYDGNARNCDEIGTGTYSISTLGDARVMQLQNLPPQAAALNYERTFVERGGKVYYGYRVKGLPYSQARMNQAAGNALVSQLGAGPQLNADSVAALLPASYAGDWIFWPASDPAQWFSSNAGIVRINPEYIGTTTGYQCFDTSAGLPTTPFACTLTLNPATGAVTLTESGSSSTATLLFNAGTATGSSIDTATSTTMAIQGRRR